IRQDSVQEHLYQGTVSPVSLFTFSARSRWLGGRPPNHRERALNVNKRRPYPCPPIPTAAASCRRPPPRPPRPLRCRPAPTTRPPHRRRRRRCATTCVPGSAST